MMAAAGCCTPRSTCSTASCATATGALCGKVDDLELERTADDGEVYVTAMLSGPGHLLYRLGRRRLGRGCATLTTHIEPLGTRRSRPHPDRADQPTSAPRVDLAVDADELSPRSPASAGSATTSSATSRGAATMRMSDITSCDVRTPTVDPSARSATSSS